MITIKFFSMIREALETDVLEMEWAPTLGDVAAVKEQLIAQGGAIWDEVLAQDDLLVARNHRVVLSSEPVSDGDELAFFPPMTGG
jgi:molybdopterin synthase sulfur carrier subunit